MKVSWDRQALVDLANIDAHILQANPAAALAMVEKIWQRAQSLTQFSHRARSGRIRGTRELVVSPYIVVYRVRTDEIVVNAVIHGNRRWPKRL